MIDDEDDIGVEDLDEVAREERKLEYGRQKTKDIGFDLPLDDDGEYEEPVEDEFEDEEDDEAQPITAGGKKLAKVVSDEMADEVQDNYSEDMEDEPPIQETKTLKQINEEGKSNNQSRPKVAAAAAAAIEDDYDDAFVEDEIEDDYD